MIDPRPGAQVLGVLIVRRQHQTDESQIGDRGHGLFLAKTPCPYLYDFLTPPPLSHVILRCVVALSPKTTMHLLQVVCLLVCALVAYAKTVSYEFNVGYVTVSAQVPSHPIQIQKTAWFFLMV